MYITGRMNYENKYSNTIKALALCKFAGVDPRLFSALISQFGSLDKLFADTPDALKEIKNLDQQTSDLVRNASAGLQLAEDFHAELSQRDINVATCFDSNFPKLLHELNDPPPVLYVRGSIPNNSRKTVTVVGTSKASQEGIELTVHLSRLFAKANVQVVSSLRGGIDGAVHLGCKANDGKSFAIIDSGFDHLDLSEQMPLAIDIAQKGGVITEYPPDVAPHTDNLSATNRLLVGLSHAVVLTEFYNDSSHTHDLLSFCGDIGKLVFIMVDPEHGALSDETALETASKYGIVPIVGFDQVGSIIKALV